MAYRLHEHKLIPTGINLAMPPDQVIPGDALQLTGWWPSSVGKLQQTKGTTMRYSGAAGLVNCISEVTGRVYYGAAGNLYRAGSSIDTGYDGFPLGMIGYQNQMWVMNRSKRVRDNGTDLIPWATEIPDVPALTPDPGGGTLPDGAYDYYVTFIDMQLYESNPSPLVNLTLGPGDNGKVFVIRPDADEPTRIFAWNVYRLSPGTNEPFLLNSDPIPYATDTFEDIGARTEEELIAADEGLEFDHNPPPAARVLADKPFNERLVAASTAEFPNRLFYGKPGQPAFFPADQFIDVGNDSSDAILGLSVKPGLLIIYRQRSIWRHIGDFDDAGASIEPVVPDKGTLGMNSWCSTSVGDFFVWNDGVYRLADWARRVSAKIDPIFQEFDLENYPLFHQAAGSTAALGFVGGRLWFSYAGGDEEAPGSSMIWHSESDRWFASGEGFNCFYQGSQFFYGGQGDRVMSVEDGLTYNGTAIHLVYQSAYEDCGFPDREKTWNDLVLVHNTQGVNLAVTIRINNKRTGGGIDQFLLTVINSTVMTREVLPINYPLLYPDVYLRGRPVRSLNLSIGIEGPGPGFIEIDAPIILHYYREAREGVTFDSGITDYGIQGVKVVDQVELDVDASAGEARLEISCDLPSGIVTSQVLENFTTTRRQTLLIVLDTPLEGKLFRYQITTTTAVQVYGVRIRLLPIGVYIDGAVGEVWQHAPIAAGV